MDKIGCFHARKSVYVGHELAASHFLLNIVRIDGQVLRAINSGMLGEHGSLAGPCKAPGHDRVPVARHFVRLIVKASYKFSLNTVSIRRPLFSVGIERVLLVSGEAVSVGLLEARADIGDVLGVFCVGEWPDIFERLGTGLSHVGWSRVGFYGVGLCRVDFRRFGVSSVAVGGLSVT